MTVVALWSSVIFVLGVAICTIQLRVDFIESQAGNGMLEVVLIPSGVTIGTRRVKPGNLLTGWMAGPAVELLVKSVERPTSFLVRESRTFLGIVTLGTGVSLVAIITNCVDLLLGLFHFGELLKIVAIAAVFLFVTIDATEAKEIDVLLMLEGDYRRARIWCLVDFLDWLSNDRVRLADDIGRIFRGSLHCTLGIGNVTEDALGIVAPFPVARKTLAVIGAFKIRFLQIRRLRTAAVAVAAGRYFSGWTEMMTSSAVGAHLGHGRVNFMIEMHRLIEVRELRQ